MTAAIVERELLGGECSYWACMPSKALLRPIAVADVTGDLQGVSTAHVTPKALLERRDYWVSHYDDSGQETWADGAGIAVVRGDGRLVGERTVRVASSSEGRRRGAGPPGGGHRHRQRGPRARRCTPTPCRGTPATRPVSSRCRTAWSSSAAGSWPARPRSGCRRSAPDVTLVVRDRRLLGRTEPFAGEAVLAGLRERGITVHLGTEVSDVRREAPEATGIGKVHGGTVTLTTSAGELDADELLLSIGRAPRLDDLGLASVGLTADDVTAAGCRSGSTPWATPAAGRR